jgi:hypothetical protein
MATLNDLQTAPFLISLLGQNNPRLTLIQSIAWFDPLDLDPTFLDYPYDFDYNLDDLVTAGLVVCRQCFPADYVRAAHLLIQGTSEQELAHFLRDRINAHLVCPIQDLEDLRAGPPLECFGFDRNEAPGYEQKSTMQDGLQLLERIARVLPRSASLDVTDTTRILSLSLANQQAPTYQDLKILLAWLTNTTGNTLADLSYEELMNGGIELPDWTPDNIEFVNEVATEAEQIITAVERALDSLEQDSALDAALTYNLQRIAQHASRNRKQGHDRILSEPECAALGQRLVWPERPGERAPDEADAHTDVLPLRHHSSPEPA